MSITTVMFDLDGTLLPMDQDVFVKDYFGRLAKKLAPYGYEPKKLIDSIWAGIAAMVQNDGAKSNEKVFWNTFAVLYGGDVINDLPLFEEFYKNEFQAVQAVCGFEPKAAEIVRQLKAQGIRVVLATNPIFPAIATQSRIRWAGLEPDDFALYTTYENTAFSKPNPNYYTDILNRLGLTAHECLMVGNDAEEDTAAAQVGMQVFLLTDCLINKSGTDLSLYPHGGFDDLASYLRSMALLPDERVITKGEA